MFNPQKKLIETVLVFRDGPFDIQGGGGGGWDYLEKNSLFPNTEEKIKCL